MSKSTRKPPAVQATAPLPGQLGLLPVPKLATDRNVAVEPVGKLTVEPVGKLTLNVHPRSKPRSGGQVLLITAKETRLFARCERIIKRGAKTFIEVGNALMRIRDDLLYREHYSTFQGYCKERWGWNRTYAHYVIQAATVADNVHNCEQPPPTSEAVARELAALPAEQQAEALVEARRLAKGEPTAKQTRQVVDEQLGRETPPATKPRQRLGVGIDRANEAAKALIAIPLNDPWRRRAHEMVLDFCRVELEHMDRWEEANKVPSCPNCGCVELDDDGDCVKCHEPVTREVEATAEEEATP